jgi:hypothetical protein
LLLELLFIDQDDFIVVEFDETGMGDGFDGEMAVRLNLHVFLALLYILHVG